MVEVELLTCHVAQQSLELLQHVGFARLVQSNDEHVELILAAHVLHETIYQRKHGVRRAVCVLLRLLLLQLLSVLQQLSHAALQSSDTPVH